MGAMALSAVGLTKRYGRMVALDGLDLEVRTGEVHAFRAERRRQDDDHPHPVWPVAQGRRRGQPAWRRSVA
jgi:hypothetical protein